MIYRWEGMILNSWNSLLTSFSAVSFFKDLAFGHACFRCPCLTVKSGATKSNSPGAINFKYVLGLKGGQHLIALRRNDGSKPIMLFMSRIIRPLGLIYDKSVRIIYGKTQRSCCVKIKPLFMLKQFATTGHDFPSYVLRLLQIYSRFAFRAKTDHE